MEELKTIVEIYLNLKNQDHLVVDYHHICLGATYPQGLYGKEQKKL